MVNHPNRSKRASFQPGPWWVNPDDRPGMAYNREIVFGDGDNRICFMAHSDGKNLGRDKANADLIAAAPSLFDALAALMNIGPRPWIEGAQVTWEAWDAAYEAAEIALAKARGED